MAVSTNQCPVCLRPKSRTSGGFVTLWVDVCHCAVTGASSENPPVQVCRTCSKVIDSGRPGSFTQWIFRAQPCSCENPAPITKDTNIETNDRVSESPLPAEDISADECELELPSHSFPTERYKPIQILGEGAAGKVYLCRDRLLNKMVAVKVLRSLSAEQMVSFQREARATSQLSHPKAVRLLDFGPTPSGIPYMVLDYFKGETLAEYRRKHGSLSVSMIKHIFLSVASALSHAHSLGIYHRDLNPVNILIEATGSNEPEVRLIDFGVAQIIHATEGSITVQGPTLVGTPEYMAPDVVQGGSYDARSEVYSFGCILFEAVSGSPPFVGDNSLEILNQHANKIAPSLSDAAGESISKDLARLVDKCLEKAPAERYQSLQELADALVLINDETLESGEADQNNVSDRDRPSKARKNGAIAVVVVLSILTPILMFAAANNLKLKMKSAPTTKSTDSKKVLAESTDWSLSEFERADDKVTSLSIQASKGDLVSQLALAQKYELGQDVGQDYSKSKSLYEISAAQGSAQAMERLGTFYAKGVGGAEVDNEKAVAWFRKAAAKDDSNAQRDLGWMYEFGLGVAQNYSEAMVWYSKAAASGNAAAATYLGNLYLNGKGVKQSDAEAIKWFRIGEAGGDMDAVGNLGFMFRHGRGVKRDLEKARKNFLAAAEAGRPKARIELGLLYKDGIGVERNSEEAVKWFRKSAEHGDPDAQCHLASMYCEGIGVKKDLREALAWYQKAADQGSALGYQSLGYMYEKGSGVKQDYHRAMQLYLMAANLKLSSAQNNIGYMYQHGLGVAKNYGEARTWYQLAAEQGHSEAIDNLGYLYRYGIGVDKDIKEALKYFGKAAAMGNSGAQFNFGYTCEELNDFQTARSYYLKAARQNESIAQHRLGLLYFRGLGVTRDYPMAMHWFLKSAAQGYADSEFNIGVMYKNGLGVPKNEIEADRWLKRASQHKAQPVATSTQGQPVKDPE